MKIYVDLDHVDITEYTGIESGEYNTNKINFIFTPEYKDLVKVAIFGCKLDTDEPKFYKIYLSDDSCYLPQEVTSASDVISIGVYAFNVDNGELKLRYSPTPVKTIVYEGSFREEAENSSSPTPTEIEQIMSRIISLEEITQDLNTRVETLENNACDLDTLKSDVETLKSDVEGISGRLDTVESDIDDLEGDIANTYSKTEVDTLLGNKVDTSTYTTGQAAQDEKIAKAELILSQLPKVTGEGTNISLSPTIEYDLEVNSLLGDTIQDGTPTPDTPIDIQVVTGTQTITISNADNTETQTYTLHLGDEELAKIGAAQDKIYYDNGKWYKYSAIGKVIIDGTKGNWSKPSTNRFNIDNLITDYYKSPNSITYVSNLYKVYEQKNINADFNTLVSNENFGLDLSSSVTSYTIRIKDTNFGDVSEYRTWLGTHNITVYYVLSTPSTTEITDDDLLQDLNYIKEHIVSFRDTTNITTSGNLPIIITASALKQLS